MSQPSIHVVLIDNHDSFVYNLVDAFALVAIAAPFFAIRCRWPIFWPPNQTLFVCRRVRAIRAMPGP